MLCYTHDVLLSEWGRYILSMLFYIHSVSEVHYSMGETNQYKSVRHCLWSGEAYFKHEFNFSAQTPPKL